MRQRSPVIIIALLLATVLLGLASRHYAMHLPSLLSKNAGDIFWDTAVFFLIALLAPRASPAILFLWAWGIGIMVELFKLYDPAWLHAFRHSTAGGLLLGHAFSWCNIICYGLGAALALAMDLGLYRKLTGAPASPVESPTKSV